jgi:hypothetical protein
VTGDPRISFLSIPCPIMWCRRPGASSHAYEPSCRRPTDPVWSAHCFPIRFSLPDRSPLVIKGCRPVSPIPMDGMSSAPEQLQTSNVNPDPIRMSLSQMLYTCERLHYLVDIIQDKSQNHDMPRTARFDAAGVLHHAMIRWIERRRIFCSVISPTGGALRAEISSETAGI